MRTGKVYIKIFLSFLGVLIITEAVIFVLFMVYAGRPVKAWADRLNAAKVVLVKETIEEIIQEKIRAEPDALVSNNESVKRFVRRFGELFEARVWLSSARGETLVQSFDGAVPTQLVERFAQGRPMDIGEFRLYPHKSRGASGLYAYLPVRINSAEQGQLHVLFEKTDPTSYHHKGFLWGLVLIGFVIALLIMPVSRLITKPIKELRRSALRIAEGDLAHRASVQSKDEIGELGRAFNKMADKLEGMIRGGKALTANVSHELRSPLARIRVAGELLQEKLTMGDARGTANHLKDIQEDVEEMDRMIGRLLTLSKLDIHEAALTPHALDPVAMVQELLERFKPMMDQKSIRTEAVLEFEGPFYADREAMITVFSNILENTCKYTPQNGFAAVRLNSGNGSLRFAVTNTTGRAFSEEQLERIFDPFYRIEGGAGPKGTGLGLAIAKKLIEKQGGAMKATQSPEGLCVSFVLASMQDPGRVRDAEIRNSDIEARNKSK
jgi:two-component system sensor histidine kinase CpxA